MLNVCTRQMGLQLKCEQDKQIKAAQQTATQRKKQHIRDQVHVKQQGQLIRAQELAARSGAALAGTGASLLPFAASPALMPPSLSVRLTVRALSVTLLVRVV